MYFIVVTFLMKLVVMSPKKNLYLSLCSYVVMESKWFQHQNNAMVFLIVRMALMSSIVKNVSLSSILFHCKIFSDNMFSKSLAFIHHNSKISVLVQPCSETEFPCSKNGLCIPLQLRCNGVNDCGDNSDEACGCESYCR